MSSVSGYWAEYSAPMYSPASGGSATKYEFNKRGPKKLMSLTIGDIEVWVEFLGADELPYEVIMELQRHLDLFRQREHNENLKSDIEGHSRR